MIDKKKYVLILSASTFLGIIPCIVNADNTTVTPNGKKVTISSGTSASVTGGNTTTGTVEVQGSNGTATFNNSVTTTNGNGGQTKGINHYKSVTVTTKKNSNGYTVGSGKSIEVNGNRQNLGSITATRQKNLINNTNNQITTHQTQKTITSGSISTTHSTTQGTIVSTGVANTKILHSKTYTRPVNPD